MLKYSSMYCELLAVEFIIMNLHIEIMKQQTSWVIALWWFCVSLWRICITLVWPSNSLKLTASSSRSEHNLHFASIRLCLALLLIISIEFTLQKKNKQKLQCLNPEYLTQITTWLSQNTQSLYLYFSTRSFRVHKFENLLFRLKELLIKLRNYTKVYSAVHCSGIKIRHD